MPSNPSTSRSLKPTPTDRMAKARAAKAAKAAQRAQQAQGQPEPAKGADALKPAVKAAVLAPHKAQTAGEAGGRPYTVRLAGRHADYLERAAAKEGRSPEQMLERIVRLEYARDSTKGYAPAELGSGQAIQGAGAGAAATAAVSGRHPGRGSE